MKATGSETTQPETQPAMSYSQYELGERFRRGETSGNASNTRIEHYKDLGLTALIGYGHAVYATRDCETGHLICYDWYGYSPSTSQQISKMKLETQADERRDERMKRGTLRREEMKVRQRGGVPA